MSQEAQEETITLPAGGVGALVVILQAAESLLADLDVEQEEAVARRDYLRSVATSLRLDIEVQR